MIYVVTNPDQLTINEKRYLSSLMGFGKLKEYDSIWEAWAEDEANYRIGEIKATPVEASSRLLQEAKKIMIDTLMEEAESFEGPRAFIDHDKLDTIARESLVQAARRIKPREK